MSIVQKIKGEGYTVYIHDDYISEDNVKPALEKITEILSKAQARKEAEKAKNKTVTV